MRLAVSGWSARDRLAAFRGAERVYASYVDLIRLLVGLILGFISYAVASTIPHVSYVIAVLIGVLVFLVVTFNSRTRI